MKQYFTKTGVELKVISGLGLGDQIKRGRLGIVGDYSVEDSEIVEKPAKVSVIGKILKIINE